MSKEKISGMILCNYKSNNINNTIIIQHGRCRLFYRFKKS